MTKLQAEITGLAVSQEDEKGPSGESWGGHKGKQLCGLSKAHGPSLRGDRAVMAARSTSAGPTEGAPAHHGLDRVP